MLFQWCFYHDGNLHKVVPDEHSGGRASCYHRVQVSLAYLHKVVPNEHSGGWASCYHRVQVSLAYLIIVYK